MGISRYSGNRKLCGFILVRYKAEAPVSMLVPYHHVSDFFYNICSICSSVHGLNLELGISIGVDGDEGLFHGAGLCVYRMGRCLSFITILHG